ncbi:MAG TPA: electron transfer flavoprotein subunit alpha [Bryobacteraceae bacterium]|nr:electron transfer flavoprotein subunit alpha [Bryobacteraceae bacterium]HPT25553.1 electron transfer flavoprotein subunit alpha [Bryobacteraceae bacterium]
MEKILVLVHTIEGGSIPRAALETLAGAQSLGGEIAVGVFGEGAGSSIGSLAVEGEAFSQPRYATDAAACEALIRASGAAIVLAPHTSRMARALPGAATRVGGVVDTHIVGLSVESGALTVSRWFYRQRIEGTLSRAARPWVLLVEPGSFEAVEAAPAGVVTKLDVAAVSKTQFVGFQSPETGEQTIRPDAETLFVAGAGWTKKQKDGQTHTPEAAELILGFVRAAKSSLGSSKSLVDMGSEGEPVLPFLTHLHQIGQTGSTPRHKKGLATCCHGEEPHVVGWRFIRERRAVNLDANCGWARGKADVLYVADAFEVMRELNKLIS